MLGFIPRGEECNVGRQRRGAELHGPSRGAAMAETKSKGTTARREEPGH